MTETDMLTDPEVVDAELVPDEAEGTEEDSSVDETPETEPDEAAESNGNGKAKGRSRRASKDKAPGKEVAKTEDKTPAPKAEPESSFTKAQANRLTSKLKGNLRASAELIMEAYDGRIWVAMGYESWEDYLNSELGEYRIKLPAVERKELVAKMSAAKSKGGSAMSSRAIASALGVDQKTVVNDRKELGLIKIPDAERADGEDTGEKVVGLDGREQSASRPSAPRIVSLVDKFTTHFVPVDSHLGDLLALTTDERWEDEAAEVAKRHRADLRRAASTLAEIMKALPGNGD